MYLLLQNRKYNYYPSPAGGKKTSFLPNNKPGQWLIRSTAVSAQELKKSAYPLPEDWRGLKDKERKLGPCDLVFTHATGFLAGVYADSQEEAIEAAKAWLELL